MGGTLVFSKKRKKNKTQGYILIMIVTILFTVEELIGLLNSTLAVIASNWKRMIILAHCNVATRLFRKGKTR